MTPTRQQRRARAIAILIISVPLAVLLALFAIGAGAGFVLRQSTAVTLPIGPFVASADGVTTYGSPIPHTSVYIYKAGAAPVTKSEASTSIHGWKGMHRFNFDTTDTNTLGTWEAQVWVDGKFQAWITGMVVTQQVWDSLYGTDKLEVDVMLELGTQPSTASAGVRNVKALTCNSVTGAVGSVTGNVGGNVTGSVGSVVGNTVQTGDSYAIVNSGTHGNATLRTLMLDVPTVAEFDARTLPAASYFDWTADTVANVTTVGTVTGHTPQTGDTFALANGASGFVAIIADTAAILVDTGTTLPATLTAMSGAGFATGTHSLVAIRTQGDAAWTTGAGGDATAANQVTLLARLSAARALLLDELANLDAILADTHALNDTKIPNTLSLANINAEVVDCLSTDTYAEPGQGAPTATSSLAAKLGFLYKNFRNKRTQTATTFSIFNDAGDTVDHKATISDDGATFTTGEIGTGP